MIQLIWTGDCYEVADERNSELPEWPVQDEGARWHYEEFNGQRAVYQRGEGCRVFGAENILKNVLTSFRMATRLDSTVSDGREPIKGKLK